MPSVAHFSSPVTFSRNQTFSFRLALALRDSMLTLSGITKSLRRTDLFADVTQLNREDRIGSSAPNGAGKSTLFSIILGEESPDDSEIITERNVNIGYLPRKVHPPGTGRSSRLLAISPEFVKLRRIIKAWEHDHPIEAQHSEDVDDVHDKYNRTERYHIEAKAKQILAGLSFREKI